MIVITGASGFIGSCVAQWYHRKGEHEVIAVDDFADRKEANLKGFEGQRIHRDELMDWLESNKVVGFIHLGARTDTTEFDSSIFERLNVSYSKQIWKHCSEHNIPLVYASSAATYGLGEFGYDDDESKINQLKPLNPYGESKNEFDQWVLAQESKPPHWYGLKFFNVYGPNEYHKGRMASVVFHAFNQIRETGMMKLFRSHHDDFADGEQLRDFVYVKDVIRVIDYLFEDRPENGIYNLGTGEARSFNDLAKAVFTALDIDPKIEYIDTPADIRDKYQYYTKAEMQKLRSTGYERPFYSLEEGVADYVTNYLKTVQYF